MPFTPDELGENVGAEVRELVEQISKAKRAIKDIKEVYGVEEAEKRLKAILHEMVSPDDKGHHAVLVDGVKAKVFMRKGSLKTDKEAAVRLLHPNTYNAIFSMGNPSKVLEVDPARTRPALDELFAPSPLDEEPDEDDGYYN
jgi:hypothetical protein